MFFRFCAQPEQTFEVNGTLLVVFMSDPYGWEGNALGFVADWSATTAA
jgi:hypothetical protein